MCLYFISLLDCPALLLCDGDILPESSVLFQINAEFKRITTVPLQSKFLSQLDLHSDNLTRLFQKRGGQLGEKLKRVTAQIVNVSDAGLLQS